MNIREKIPVLLIVDDDEEDIYLTEKAFKAHRPDLLFRSVQSADELFDYLEDTSNRDSASKLPAVILLDINLPVENGFSILQRLKSHEDFGHIPVCMFTTSAAPQDIKKAYQLGASSFVCKSVSAKGMKELVEQFCTYWFQLAKLAS